MVCGRIGVATRSVDLDDGSGWEFESYARGHRGLSLCLDEGFAVGDHVSYEASEAASIPVTVVR